MLPVLLGISGWMRTMFMGKYRGRDGRVIYEVGSERRTRGIVTTNFIPFGIFDLAFRKLIVFLNITF